MILKFRLVDQLMTDAGRPVFWLNGSAGTGKSTIASTVAKMFSQQGILGATFFCSRDDALCSNEKLIFPSIAYQLAHFNSEFGQRLARAIKSQPEITHAAVSFQLQKLIVEPLATISNFPPCAIIIDGLDECRDRSTISVILTALSHRVDKLRTISTLR